MSIRYNNIIYNDMANGEGMRISFFTQGCSHHCKGCFNKDIAWDFNGGKNFTVEVLNEIMFVFRNFKDGYNGLSILGGEPLDNLIVVKILIDTFRNEYEDSKTIWLYSGYTFEQILEDKNKLELLSKCDVLIDGKFTEELYNPDLKFRGSENQRIILVRESLLNNKIIEFKGVSNETKL